MTEMLPQPPPDAPPPPPSEAALRSQKWWNGMLVVGIGSMLLLVIAAPLMFRSRKKGDQVEAVNNLRQIGLALFEFERDYGSFPDDETAKVVKEATLSTLALGSANSNDYFRQLIAANICQSETMFYARSARTKKADNVFTGSEALKKGECAFAYIAGLTLMHPSETPIAVFPLKPGKHAFDKKLCDKHYDGKAVVLRMDKSVKAHRVDATGRVWINGKDLFDPSQPFWGGKAPDVKWPE